MMAARGRFLPVDHGTDHKNSQRCRRRPEGICDDCRRVFADYMRTWRRDNAQARAKQRAYNAARTRAWARLQQAHPQEYWALLDQELKRGKRQDEAAA